MIRFFLALMICASAGAAELSLKIQDNGPVSVSISENTAIRLVATDGRHDLILSVINTSTNRILLGLPDVAAQAIKPNSTVRFSLGYRGYIDGWQVIRLDRDRR